MSDSTGKSDTMPLTWMGRVPVYASSILAAVLVAGMILTVLLKSANIDFSAIAFEPQAFWKRAFVWQLFTHPLIDYPSFFYVFGILFTYWFGVGVETYLGRRILLRLLFLLCLVPVLTASAWWLGGHFIVLAGASNLSIGLFIAYATLYPNAELWNWITMKWLAFAGIVLNSLMYFPEHRWDQLTVFLSACAAAHLYTRYEQGHWAMPRLRWPRRKPALRVVPRDPAGSASLSDDEPEDELESEVDALLEKIARNGLASLSAKERQRLEQAREELLKKDRR
ncbi:MAG: DUF6576 domain-containing protein [Chthoniobacteraceae bacterium]